MACPGPSGCSGPLYDPSPPTFDKLLRETVERNWCYSTKSCRQSDSLIHFHCASQLDFNFKNLGKKQLLVFLVFLVLS